MAHTHRKGDKVVLEIKAGSEAAGFARFLMSAAEALRLGHIQPTNPHGGVAPDVAAMRIRQLADRINGVNS
jgi:hypothetical protein